MWSEREFLLPDLLSVHKLAEIAPTKLYRSCSSAKVWTERNFQNYCYLMFKVGYTSTSPKIIIAIREAIKKKKGLSYGNLP